MMKFMTVTFKNGETWRFPAYLIARERALYYAEHDTGETRGKEFDRVYKEEFDYTMRADDELYDWFANNMNWSDVKDRATLVPKEGKPFDYENGLRDAGRVIVNIGSETES